MLNIKMQASPVQSRSPKITVIGVGGGGGNAVNNMISSGLEGCEFVVCNSDAQALDHSLCRNKVQLGVHIAGGLGAGAKPEIGKAAAEESLEAVMKYLEGANMAFVTAGMGGGTGTGAAPVIAKACREQGILTVGVITKPFHFEGTHRMRMADAGIEEMQQYVDTLIVIPNQNLFRVANEKTTFAEGFRMADSVLQSGVRGVTDLMVRPGLVNLDFADIRTAMQEMGKAMMGTGEARGDKRAIQAAEAAINNPLLDDVSMKGAHGVIINVTGGYDMTLFEADEACNRIRDEVDPDANIIFGATFDESLDGLMRVSILATGIEKDVGKAVRSQGGLSPDYAAPRQLSAPPQAYRPPASVNLPAQQPSYPAPLSLTPPAAVSAAPSPAKPIYAPPAPQPQHAAPPVQQQPASKYEAESDMFEQSRYSEDMDSASGSGSFSASGGSTGIAPHNTALRGTRYRDSFIPPLPAQTTQYEKASMPAARVETQAAQAFPVQSGQTASAQAAAPRKRSPSLFERIADNVHQRLDTIMGGAAENEEAPPAGRQSATPQNAQTFGHHPAAARLGPVTDNAATPMPQAMRPFQQKLNIDSPSAPASQGSKSDLEIPAFLRRQAN